MWAVVGTFSTVGEAESARSALDAAGITSRVSDENTISVDWLYSNALGGVKLLVDTEQLDEAAEISSTTAGSSSSDIDAEDTPLTSEEDAANLSASADDRRCPACQSSDVARVPRLKLLVAFAIVAFGVGVAVNQPALALAAIAAVVLIAATLPSHRCLACGERWNAEDQSNSAPVTPLPDAADILETPCPRCGSSELYHVAYRRLKSIPLLAVPAIVLIVPVWLFLPKWKCDACGLKLWSRPAPRK